MQRITVPTGDILIKDGMEFLSLGDYGAVLHGDLLPLETKWVITISTQYGCSMMCKFCDVPKVGPGKNIPIQHLMEQVIIARSLHPEVTSCDRLNVHFARMGEPSWNPDVIKCAKTLKFLYPGFIVHPVVSTMLPKDNKNLHGFLSDWIHIKNDVYDGNAGLQFSINSTDEVERAEMFSGNCMSLEQISCMMDTLPHPKGRKITLNFALANYTIDPITLLNFFDPDDYIIKLTPMHGLETPQGYEKIADDCRNAGYDVEDLGRIT
jgi:23S rRNA (adenine2503-C2)-methyltransferase